MRRALTITLAIMITMIATAPASAQYYLGKREAQRLARQDARERYADYGVSRPYASYTQKLWMGVKRKAAYLPGC